MRHWPRCRPAHQAGARRALAPVQVVPAPSGVASPRGRPHLAPGRVPQVGDGRTRAAGVPAGIPAGQKDYDAALNYVQKTFKP